jgi:hypothetical protein
VPNLLIGSIGSRDMAYLAKLRDTLRRRLAHSLTMRRMRSVDDNYRSPISYRKAQGMTKDCRLTALPASLGDAAML